MSSQTEHQQEPGTPSSDDQRALAYFMQEMARRFLLLEAGLADGVSDLTKTELQTLELMALEGADTVSSIAALGKVPTSTASWIVNQLVKKDYLERHPDPDDRRVIRLSLSEKGQEVLSFLQQTFEALAGETLALATPPEQRALVSLAKRLQAERSSAAGRGEQG